MRRKPYKPVQMQVQGDLGPNTAAQRDGSKVEPVEGDKNGMHRKRRVDWLEKYLKGEKCKKTGNMRIKPFLSMRQYQAGCEIRNALEATQKSPDQTGERVDASPKPDANIDRQVDAISRYAAARKSVPRDHAYVVDHVCEQNRPLSGLPKGHDHRSMLQVALDLAADDLGY